MEQLQEKVNNIAQEIALFQLNELKRNAELEKRIKELEKLVGQFQQSHTGLERVGRLEERIKILEEARQKQILINNKVLNYVDEMEKATNWDYFK